MTDKHEPPVHQRADKQQHGSSPQAGRSRWRLLARLGTFTLAQVSATIITLLVGAGLALLGTVLFAKPTTAEQIQAFELRQGAEGYTLVQELSGDLHGDGTESFEFLMRNGAGERFPLPRANSDRLFIFDDDNGTLRQASEFQPAVADGQTGDAIEPYVGRIDGLFDAFGTGRQDIVGSWNYYLIAEGQYAEPRPFVIWWNIARGRYGMTPILKADVARSAITKVRNPGIAGRTERPCYLHPLTLHDVNSSATFASVDADDYAPTMRNSHLVLVAAYVLRGPGLGRHLVAGRSILAPAGGRRTNGGRHRNDRLPLLKRAYLHASRRTAIQRLRPGSGRIGDLAQERADWHRKLLRA